MDKVPTVPCRDELLDAIDTRAVVCPVGEPAPIAFINVYEQGDVWVKTQGCEGCSWDSMKKCCGNCPLLTRLGCTYHLEPDRNKPFRCVVQPAPDVNRSYCQLEFLCVRGRRKGLKRRVREPRDVFTVVA